MLDPSFNRNQYNRTNFVGAFSPILPNQSLRRKDSHIGVGPMLNYWLSSLFFGGKHVGDKARDLEVLAASGEGEAAVSGSYVSGIVAHRYPKDVGSVTLIAHILLCPTLHGLFVLWEVPVLTRLGYGARKEPGKNLVADFERVKTSIPPSPTSIPLVMSFDFVFHQLQLRLAPFDFDVVFVFDEHDRVAVAFAARDVLGDISIGWPVQILQPFFNCRYNKR
ncbi:unnamed protein product [Camellia sinensis]